MNSTPFITWTNANLIAPTKDDADSNGNIWVAGKNAGGIRRVRYESWKLFNYHPQFTIEWARTGV